MAEVHEKTFRHRGSTSEKLQALVAAEEKIAEKKLGGPVLRTHKFSPNGGEDITFTWTLKEANGDQKANSTEDGKAPRAAV